MKSTLLCLFALSILLVSCKPKEEAAAPAPDPNAKPPQAEFTDPKYSDIARQGLENLSSGDIDAFGSALSDSARYYWSGGDSLVGKPAIVAYWKDRRGNVIDKLSYANDIWFAIKVNESQKGPDTPGVWVLGWWQTSVTYKNGKSLSMWVHSNYHFDSNDKIDRVVQYIDRAPINAALAAK